MGHKGRHGLTRKAVPTKSEAKKVRKFTATTNVEKRMKTSVSARQQGHQPRRRERPARKVDLERYARLEREPSPDEPRPDGRFVFSHPKSKLRKRAASTEVASPMQQ
mmetsp:Transcript_18108/g.53849  ORF Transcript_18108/g.53849 Transcript_18108/m.53849 type:complete len:107 (+) Transcript_18108:208-528(+)